MTLEERFWNKVRKDGPNDCWLWVGCLQRGYGYISAGGRRRRAHRVSYEWAHGPIPKGLILDHLCRNRACVNPLHLEPVTNQENILRGIGIGAINAAKTHCPQGHEFTFENTIRRTDKGHRGRECRRCKNDWQKQYRQRRRA